METEAFVHIDLEGKTYLVGRLWFRVRNGRESASFEYSKDWLEYSNRFALEPALMLAPGSYYTPAGKVMFGALGDSAPDRWGRVLMRRSARRLAKIKEQAPRTLTELDYLLRVNDEARQGALRFSSKIAGPFLSDDAPSIPPLINLPALLSATERLSDDRETAEDLALLLMPGSSLGGARPKASVRDKDDCLAIAKFPHAHDENNTVLWEVVALTLAEKADITVPDFRVELIGNKHVLILKRFDRTIKKRIPYLSAMSMLNASDNQQKSYLEIADAIRRYGAFVRDDLKQLWRRLVFNVLVSNTDDHLRNHGFLYVDGKGWCLSPAFDLNPVPVEIKPRVLSTTIDFYDGTASLELALSVISHFGLNKRQASEIVAEVVSAVSQWREVAKRIGLSGREIENMSSAFEHDDLDQVLSHKSRQAKNRW